jgi:hypothetical protein
MQFRFSKPFVRFGRSPDDQRLDSVPPISMSVGAIQMVSRFSRGRRLSLKMPAQKTVKFWTFARAGGEKHT